MESKEVQLEFKKIEDRFKEDYAKRVLSLTHIYDKLLEKGTIDENKRLDLLTILSTHFLGNAIFEGCQSPFIANNLASYAWYLRTEFNTYYTGYRANIDNFSLLRHFLNSFTKGCGFLYLENKLNKKDLAKLDKFQFILTKKGFYWFDVRKNNLIELVNQENLGKKEWNNIFSKLRKFNNTHQLNNGQLKEIEKLLSLKPLKFIKVEDDSLTIFQKFLNNINNDSAFNHFIDIEKESFQAIKEDIKNDDILKKLKGTLSFITETSSKFDQFYKKVLSKAFYEIFAENASYLPDELKSYIIASISDSLEQFKNSSSDDAKLYSIKLIYEELKLCAYFKNLSHEHQKSNKISKSNEYSSFYVPSVMDSLFSLFKDLEQKYKNLAVKKGAVSYYETEYLVEGKYTNIHTVSLNVDNDVIAFLRHQSQKHIFLIRKGNEYFIGQFTDEWKITKIIEKDVHQIKSHRDLFSSEGKIFSKKNMGDALQKLKPILHHYIDKKDIFLLELKRQNRIDKNYINSLPQNSLLIVDISHNIHTQYQKQLLEDIHELRPDISLILVGSLNKYATMGLDITSLGFMHVDKKSPDYDFLINSIKQMQEKINPLQIQWFELNDINLIKEYEKECANSARYLVDTLLEKDFAFSSMISRIGGYVEFAISPDLWNESLRYKYDEIDGDKDLFFRDELETYLNKSGIKILPQGSFGSSLLTYTFYPIGDDVCLRINCGLQSKETLKKIAEFFTQNLSPKISKMNTTEISDDFFKSLPSTSETQKTQKNLGIDSFKYFKRHQELQPSSKNLEDMMEFAIRRNLQKMLAFCLNKYLQIIQEHKSEKEMENILNKILIKAICWDAASCIPIILSKKNKIVDSDNYLIYQRGCYIEDLGKKVEKEDKKNEIDQETDANIKEEFSAKDPHVLEEEGIFYYPSADREKIFYTNYFRPLDISLIKGHTLCTSMLLTQGSTVLLRHFNMIVEKQKDVIPQLIINLKNYAGKLAVYENDLFDKNYSAEQLIEKIATLIKEKNFDENAPLGELLFGSTPNLGVKFNEFKDEVKGCMSSKNIEHEKEVVSRYKMND